MSAYGMRDWYASAKLVFAELLRDVLTIQQALDAGNIGAVRMHFELLRRNMEHTCQRWQAPPFYLDNALLDVMTWRRHQFPTSTVSSTMTHLQREVAELAAAPSDAEEIADVLVLLAGLADLQHIDLAAAVTRKLAINTARQWGQPDADGIVEHVRNSGEGNMNDQVISIKDMTVMPCETGCPDCGREHAQDCPHDIASVRYQMWFHQHHGRWPSWRDGLAHCSPEIIKAWERGLGEVGLTLDATASDRGSL